MTHIAGFFLCIFIALTTSFSATWFAVQNRHGFEQVKLGAWSMWVKAGSTTADPYTKAIISKSGEVPLQAAEGLELIATHDDNGRSFKAACTYAISGALPAARFWTLNAYTKDGQIASNIAERYGLTSTEIVRDEAGNFEINISATIQPGNWLPVAPLPFQLILRLYDTSTGSSTAELQAAIHLTTTKKSCL